MALCQRCNKYKAKVDNICGYCARKTIKTKSKRTKPSGESFYHRASKAILAAFFLNQGYEVAYEFPIVSIKKHDAAAKPWHLHRNVHAYPITADESMTPFLGSPSLHPQPSREWLIQQEMTPSIIYDLVVFENGQLKIAYEIKYKHGCDSKKCAIIQDVRAKSEAKYQVFEISARWLLGQIKLPKKLKTLREI